jgi:hypothetical protein
VIGKRIAASGKTNSFASAQATAALSKVKKRDKCPLSVFWKLSDRVCRSWFSGFQIPLCLPNNGETVITSQ